MSEVYQQRKDPDGFLYITYTDESALGGQWESYLLPTLLTVVYQLYLNELIHQHPVPLTIR